MNLTTAPVLSSLEISAATFLLRLEAPEIALSCFKENSVALEWYGRVGLKRTSQHPVWVWKKEDHES